MGWEDRGKRRYYYESVRVEGRVVKHYFGSGILASLTEHYSSEARRASADEADAIRDERNRLEPLAVLMTDLDRSCRRLIEATLLAAGFHLHCRSWRKTGARRTRRET